MTRPLAAIVSFRLGGPDGVSIEAAKWQWALAELGFDTTTVAGSGPVDHLLPGLAIDAATPPSHGDIELALGAADLVLVENLCSLPLNPAAAAVVADVVRGRRCLMHHHDLPWQRERFAEYPVPPDDPAWAHVTINELSRDQLSERGITSAVIYNHFDLDPPTGDRASTRSGLGVGEDELLFMQPTRALDRKNVPAAVEMAAQLGATYWLLGPAEDGYDDELRSILGAARTRVIHGYGPNGEGTRIVDAYSACDLVLLPSLWEGFGNPSVESAVHRKPLVIGPYPVAREIERFGFSWFAHDDYAGVREYFASSDRSVVERNWKVAAEDFDLRKLPRAISELMGAAGWATW